MRLGFRISAFPLVVVVSALYATPGWAWGHRGHQTLATVGAKLVDTKSRFWSTNATAVGVLTNVPDQYWKDGDDADEEKPCHWFQPDSYFPNPSQFSQFPHSYTAAVKRFGEDTIVNNGTAPWRVQQFYDLAVAAFKKGDFKTGLQIAGAMTHYIGDLSQPLHVTKNFDGGETGDSGIHAFFETENLDNANANTLTADVTSQAEDLLKDPHFTSQFNGSVVDVMFREIDRAYPHVDEIIQIDLKKGRSRAGAAAQLVIAKSRLADGAATVALILERLSQDAGLTSTQALKVATPAWIAPEYDASKPVKPIHSNRE